MVQEQQFKRHTAYKLRIGDILIGKPVMNNVNETERFAFLELGNRKVFRINIVGNIVERYDAEPSDSGEGKKYVFFTLDDGSGQIRLKIFGDDSERFKNVSQGQTVVIIGTLKHWNNELYIAPEIIRETVPKYLLLRKLETEKEKGQKNYSSNVQEKEQIIAIKDRILDMVKGSEDNGGIELETLIEKLKDFSPGLINQEIQRLLEEGIIFEPRPGRIRYLG